MPRSGKASTAVYWNSSNRRGRPEVFRAEPWTIRTWWMVMLPAVPVSITALEKSMPEELGSMAPQNTPPLWWSKTGHR